MTLRNGNLIGRLVLLAALVGSLNTRIAGAAETARRLVFLGPQGPRVLQVAVESGRFSVDETRRRYSDGLFEILDADKDGFLSPAEAVRIPIKARLRQRDQTVGDGWAALDTDPVDQKLSPAELFTFVGRELGEPVAVTRQAPRLQQTVRLYEDLDLNHDGRIDAVEVEQGLTILRSLDFDDDETLSLAELQPFPNSILQARQRAAAQSQPNPLLMISSEAEIAAAAKQCRIVYSRSEPRIPPTAVPAIEERIFRAFDRDKDGQWNDDDLKLFLQRSPVQMTLSVALETRTVRISGPAAGARGATSVDVAGVPVEWVARSRLSQRVDSTRLFLIRVRTSDADKNGYLDEGEFNGLQAGEATFSVVDLDGNQQVTAQEVEKFFLLDGLAAQSQLQLSLSDEAKTLFDVLDNDRDRRLKLREFVEGRDRLLAHDANKDGALVPGEFASAYKVTFSQPELLVMAVDDAAAMAGMRQAPGFNAPSQTGPVWFQRMDRNTDLEVSWREFLGPREDFDRLDINHDGWIDATEAAR